MRISVTINWMEFDTSGWSGDGAFTQVLVDALRALPGIRFVKVEDAPASRADAAFSFIYNEVYVGFVPEHLGHPAIPTLSSALESLPGIGAPDYADEGMLQYLRTERVIPPYQTRGFKLVELVRIYEAGWAPSQNG
jgi:hypothetical protein